MATKRLRLLLLHGNSAAASLLLQVREVGVEFLLLRGFVHTRRRLASCGSEASDKARFWLLLFFSRRRAYFFRWRGSSSVAVGFVDFCCVRSRLFLVILFISRTLFYPVNNMEM